MYLIPTRISVPARSIAYQLQYKSTFQPNIYRFREAKINIHIIRYTPVTAHSNGEHFCPDIFSFSLFVNQKLDISICINSVRMASHSFICVVYRHFFFQITHIWRSRSVTRLRHGIRLRIQFHLAPLSLLYVGHYHNSGGVCFFDDVVAIQNSMENYRKWNQFESSAYMRTFMMRFLGRQVEIHKLLKWSKCVLIKTLKKSTSTESMRYVKFSHSHVMR